MGSRIHELLDKVLMMPGILQWRMRRFDEGFARGQYGGFRGVYGSFQEAAAAAPTSLPLGYDHEGPAAMYRDYLHRVWPYDYPMMLWLDKVLRTGARKVFDLGGHVGINYYAYQKYVEYPDDMSWTIFDVPAVAEAGKKLAEKIDARKTLQFTDVFDGAKNADVLFTAGCLQYLEDSLATKVASLPDRPPWILVNQLPLHETKEYWTVQNVFKAFCPYHVQHKAKFFSDMTSLGYEPHDVWEHKRECHVAFEPKNEIDVYYGAAFRLK